MSAVFAFMMAATSVVAQPADIGAAAKACTAALSAKGLKASAFKGWTVVSRSPDGMEVNYARGTVKVSTSALPQLRMCGISAPIGDVSQFDTVSTAIGAALKTSEVTGQHTDISAKRAGSAFFDTKAHTIAMTAAPVDGGPGVILSILPRR